MAGLPLVRIVAVAAGLAGTSAGAWAQGAASPRLQLEKMERALAEAASRVSRPAAITVLGAADICRGYRLQGVGAWFVVAPRSLPDRPPGTARPEVDLAKADDELARVIANLEQAVQASRSGKEQQALRSQIEGLMNRRRELRAQARAAAERERELRAWQEVAEAMHLAAEAARQDAKRSIALLEKIRGPIEVEGEAAPGPSSRKISSDQDRGPAARSSHSVPPLLPFKIWAEPDSIEETRDADAILRDVRDAITQALAEHGPAVALPPNEMIAVAVDFFRPAPLACSKPPARTLVIRAPRKLLAALASGTMTPADARKQFETLEY
jgi:hypothetical protein